MSKALKIVLVGIILILSSLFLIGICLWDMCDTTVAIQGITLGLFVMGVITSIIGLAWHGEDEEEE